MCLKVHIWFVPFFYRPSQTRTRNVIPKKRKGKNWLKILPTPRSLRKMLDSNMLRQWQSCSIKFRLLRYVVFFWQVGGGGLYYPASTNLYLNYQLFCRIKKLNVFLYMETSPPLYHIIWCDLLCIFLGLTFYRIG